jgi:PAS domain S-box-containing protein
MEDGQERIEVCSELGAVIDAIRAMVWTARPDGYVDFYNKWWFEYTGLSVDEALGWGWQAIVPPEDLPEIVERWRAIMASDEPNEIETRLKRFDGEYRWFLHRNTPLRDATGKIVKWVGVSTDIEDRKRTEALLAGVKQLFEMVASGYPLLLILESLCRLLDRTAEGSLSSVLLLDRTHTTVQHAIGPGIPSSYNKALEGSSVSCAAGPCGMAAVLNRQVIVSDTASDTRWDGQGWPSLALAHGLKSCWCTPILSSTGESLGTFTIYQRHPGSPTPFHQMLIEKFTHIASIAIERTRSEEALKRSEAFLAEAQRVSATGSFYWRVATEEIMWSQQAYRIYEFDPAVTMTPQLIRTRIHPEYVEFFDEIIDRARCLGGDFDNEHLLQMPDGSVKYLRVVAHGTRNQAGELEYIGAIHDITERRLAEIALDKVRSELAHVATVTSLGAMTASIAHEVNQPLSGIITNASTCLRMLNADPPNVEGARETARRTIRDAERASDVIKRLRALFARKDATIESVDLNEATLEVIALSLNELQRNRVTLRREFADDLPPVIGDRVQLQQVILNLLLNASQAMSGVEDRPRQLVLRTQRDEGDRVRLTVEDAGMGFKPQDAGRLFEAFYTTKSGGMGIGLSISRSIIESHGGRLWAAPNDGPGATFSFSIPRASGDVKGVELDLGNL